MNINKRELTGKVKEKQSYVGTISGPVVYVLIF